MDYKEKFERANSTLMHIITELIIYHITDNSKRCVEAIDKVIEPYAIARLADLEQEKEK